MITELERATQTLRELVMAGAFPAEQKLPEEAVASHLVVSRTTARLAMGALEREGLLSHSPRRGYRVRGFTLAFVADAIEVRGELEAMAARILAERGDAEKILADLRWCITRSETLLADRNFDVERRAEWARCNLRFHRTLVNATGNQALIASFDQLLCIPLVSPEVIVFKTDDGETGRQQLARAQADHIEVVEAIHDRRGTLAAEIMRAHAYRSARFKHTNYAERRENAAIVGGRGVKLVIHEGRKPA